MRYLHTMLRVRNLDQALDFYCNKLGLKEERRRVDEKGRYTLVFLAAPEDEGLVETSKKKSGRDAPLVELTYNWDSEDYGEARHFGHLAYEVDDIYATCEKLMRKVHASLKAGGRAVTLEFIPEPDRVTPPTVGAFALTMLATTPAGDAYTFAEYEQMFRRAGFARNELHNVPGAVQRAVVSVK